MRYKLGWIYLLFVLIASGCASSRAVTSGKSATDYNGYNEDLTSVRPVYNSTSTPTSSSSTKKPTVPATTSSVTPSRTDNRKMGAPIEAMHINRRLDLVLDTIATQNRTIRYAPGFRIQVYVGNQRQEAEAAKLAISQNFPELTPYLSYNQPTYKLKVGDFMRRLDAERYFTSIHRLITSAQLQADKVDIRRSLLIK
ncbi:hypothetical protein GCM10028805_12830 [Spirosoma harenae]